MKKVNLFPAQLKVLLKKDLSLLFRKKVAFFIFFGPFLLMFLMIGLPAMFTSSQPLEFYVYNADGGYNGINIGTSIVGNLTQYYSTSEQISLTVVSSYAKLTSTKDLGLFIPENFSLLAFTAVPQLYYIDMTKSPFVDQIWNEINAVASKVMTTVLANRTIPPILNEEIPPPQTGEQVNLSNKAIQIAFPIGYMIFLLVALNSSSNSLIGFAREKRMRTMEILLAYTKNHRYLVVSKTITALVASLGSTLSYVLGIAVGASLSLNETQDLFSVFGFDFKALNLFDFISIFLVVVFALLISTSITMALDTYIAREASERLSPLVSIGFAMFFYFVVISSPVTLIPFMLINPFYWCYRLGLLLVNGKINFEIFLYLFLILGLLLVLIQLSTKGIEKEKNLYLD